MKILSILVCPVCGESLVTDSVKDPFFCANGHSFDTSKEGYVNLVTGSKSGENRGDSRDSARARHALLEKGYYSILRDAITERMHGVVLDICCGEGYYDSLYEGDLYGFDLSKEMVRLAAKRAKSQCQPHTYFVANLAKIPVADKSIDVGIHLFAPFNEAEFSRILKDNGVLYSVIPGENHLFEMKEIVYDTPYKNDEEPPKTGEYLHLVRSTRVTDKVNITGEDLKTLFSMTPYYYRTSEADRAKLDGIGSISLTVDFVILEYRR